MKIWELIDWELSGVVGWMAMAIMVPCLAFYSIGLRSEPNRPSGDRIGLAENIAGEGSPNKEVGEEILERPQDSGRCNYGATGTMPYEISVPVLGINNACVEILPDGDHLYDPEGDWNFGWYGGSTHPTVSGLGAYICHTGFGIDALCDNLGSLREGD
ncbi:hypothetical protein FWH09_03210, partial [Candidatus Saccharibacteria bacterium]|nr:hypothetical protein [Candidatus Saccharibacteria bacterium]